MQTHPALSLGDCRPDSMVRLVALLSADGALWWRGLRTGFRHRIHAPHDEVPRSQVTQSGHFVTAANNVIAFSKFALLSMRPPTVLRVMSRASSPPIQLLTGHPASRSERRDPGERHWIDHRPLRVRFMATTDGTTIYVYQGSLLEGTTTESMTFAFPGGQCFPQGGLAFSFGSEYLHMPRTRGNNQLHAIRRESDRPPDHAGSVG